MPDGAIAPVKPANPKLAAANEALKRKMQRAVLVEKRLAANGRLGTFVLRPEAGGEFWDFKAGQFTTLGLDTLGGFVPRAYSIASSPLDRTRLEFYIALVEGGALTPTFFAQEPGAIVHYLSPKGHFTIQSAHKPVLVMVATGTGVAPFIAQLRTLWRLHQVGIPCIYRMFLLHGCAHADEFGYAEELSRYAAARDQGFDLSYIRTASRPDEGRGWTPAIGRGRVNEVLRAVLGQPVSPGREAVLPEGFAIASLRAHLVPQDTAVLACGNPGVLADLAAPLAAYGITTYEVEEFWKA